MKKSCSWAIFLLVAVIVSASAQDYRGKARIIGFVFDMEGKPIEGVTVRLFSLKAEQGFETQTDKEGKWVGAQIIGGGWNVDFEKLGYLPKKIAIAVEEWKRNPEFRVNLEKAQGLVITEDLKEELTKGNQLFDEKKYDEALVVFQDIITKYPDAFIINKNVGNCYFEQEKYDQAEAAYQKILEKDATNADALMMIGNCYTNRGQNDKALEWYGKIEFEKLNDPIVLYNVGTSFYNNSKFEDALKYYKKAVEIKPDFLDGLYQLGLTHLTMGNYPDSIAAFESYLKVDPDSTRSSQVKSFLEFLKKK